jgi:hypothetical protein
LYCRGNPIGRRDPGGTSDVNGTPDQPSAPESDSGKVTFEKDTIAGYTSRKDAGSNPAPRPVSPQAGPAPAQGPARTTPPVPATPPPTPIATDPPSPLKAQILAKGLGTVSSVDQTSLDEKKYLDTWKHPAMSNVTNGLSDAKASEFNSKIHPTVMALLNAPFSPSTRSLSSHGEQFQIGKELLCLHPLINTVNGEAKNATFPIDDGDGGVTNPRNFSDQRWAAGRPATLNVLDAFGHCYGGCRIAQECGALVGLMWQREREAWREAGYGGPHDSFPQDVHNFSRGVLIVISQPDAGVDCLSACADAADSLLDLSAPTRVETRP